MTFASRHGVAVLGAAVMLVGCSSPDDQTQIENLIRSAIRATHDRKPSGVLERVAEDFKGPSGIDRSGAQRMLVGRLLQKKWTRVFERGIDIEVTDGTARASIDVVLAQGRNVERWEDLLPTEASVGRFVMILSKRDDGWWITEGKYTKTKSAF